MNRDTAIEIILLTLFWCRVLRDAKFLVKSGGHDRSGSSVSDYSHCASLVYRCVHEMTLQETILCAASPSSPNVGSGLIAIHDIQTGATLASFKQCNAGSHCVAVFESRHLQGGFILASQPDKSIMNVYDFQKVQEVVSVSY